MVEKWRLACVQVQPYDLYVSSVQLFSPFSQETIYKGLRFALWSIRLTRDGEVHMLY